MPSLSPRLPTNEALILGLASIFGRDGNARHGLSVLRRQPSIYSSTFPGEIVTCQLGKQRPLRLLCKYAGRQFYTGHGHRGGVPYEAEVYRQVLEPARVSTPVFYGSHRDAETRSTWLVLEYLDRGERANKAPGAMARAARWIGRFHATQEGRLADAPMRFLNRYDARYYRGWARRTVRFAGPLHRRFSWLAPLCLRFQELIPLLLAAPPTVIHGEYYPRNILSQGRLIRPVDWESAAIGAGEIDLACLTEGWPAETVRRCQIEYSRARWPSGAPAGFERTLVAARLYMSLRWLGDEREATTSMEYREYFSFVRSLGQRLGLI